jgi:hypothetical protein
MNSDTTKREADVTGNIGQPALERGLQPASTSGLSGHSILRKTPVSRSLKRRERRAPDRQLLSHPRESVSELLILPDGQILVHNLTAAFADVLHELNPTEKQITARTRSSTHHALSRRSGAKAEIRTTSHELPN